MAPRLDHGRRSRSGRQRGRGRRTPARRAGTEDHGKDLVFHTAVLPREWPNRVESRVPGSGGEGEDGRDPGVTAPEVVTEDHPGAPDPRCELATSGPRRRRPRPPRTRIGGPSPSSHNRHAPFGARELPAKLLPPNGIQPQDGSPGKGVSRSPHIPNRKTGPIWAAFF